LLGGIDKRELAKDKRAVYEMVAKLPPLIEKGGYVPHVDHAIPHNVPLRNYIYFRELITKITEGRGLGKYEEVDR
jgi:uroporphyrinogen decarboxylase